MLLIRNEPLSRYTGYENHEELNGALTLSLTSFNVDNPGHVLLEEETVIEALDGREYRIKQMKENKVSKSIEAVSTFFDLGGHQKNEIYGGTRTFKEFADWLFAGTGWTYEAGDVSGSKLIPNYGNDNFLQLLEILLSVYECERQILPGKIVRFAKKLGPDRDTQYRYGHNVKALSRSVDTTSLYTSIKGYGGDGLVVTYTSPDASKFPHAGEQEPIRDERFTIAASLLEKAKQALDDTPKVAIELDALELMEKELGERVWLIYEPLGIEFQTRILAKTTRIPAEKSSAVIGNSMPKTLTDALTDTNVKIDEHDKQNQSKFEQTNEKITTEVERLDGDVQEAYSRIEQTADSIRSEVGAVKIELEDEFGKGIAESMSYIEQTALGIEAGVATQIEYVDGRISEAETQIQIVAGSITTALNSATEYTDTKTNLLNQEIGYLDDEIHAAYNYMQDVEGKAQQAVDSIGTLQSDIATLDGEIIAVSEQASADIQAVAGSITAAVSTTRTYAETVAGDAKTDATRAAKSYTDGQIQTVQTTATSNFNLLSGRINAKADSTTVTALGTRVRTAELDIDAVSGQISSKVSYTDYTGTTIASKINQSASSISISASAIDLEGIVRVSDSLELGRMGNGRQKALKFNNNRAWVYSTADNIYISADYIFLEGRVEAYHPRFGNGNPVIVGYSGSQNLAIGLDGSYLNIYDASGNRRRIILDA